MIVEVEQNIPCRSYDLIVDKEALHRHHDLLTTFINRGVLSPRGGSSGPHLKGERTVPDRYRIVHFLNETVCNEYEREMGIAPPPSPASP